MSAFLLVARDTHFVLQQAAVAATVSLATQSPLQALLAAVLASAVASLFASEWSPSVFSAVLVPIAVGGLPGAFLVGPIVGAAFDYYGKMRAPPASDELLPADADADAKVVDIDASVQRRVHIVLFVCAIAVAYLYSFSVMGGGDVARVYAFVQTLLAAAVFGFIVLLGRSVGDLSFSRAWFTLGVVLVLPYPVVAMTILLAGSYGWSLAVYAMSTVVALVAVRLLTLVTSREVSGAAFSFMDMFG